MLKLSSRLISMKKGIKIAIFLKYNHIHRMFVTLIHCYEIDIHYNAKTKMYR